MNLKTSDSEMHAQNTLFQAVRPGRRKTMFRKRTFVSVLVVVCWLICTGPAVQAQTDPIYEQGFKPFGSFQGGDIDTINIMNRELSLHIPIASYPQRGGKLHLSYYIAHFNGFVNTWIIRPTCPNGTGCYTYLYPAAGVGITLDAGFLFVRRNDITYPYKVSIRSSDGSTHDMDVLSLDGTGYKISPAPWPIPNCPFTDTVTDRDGIISTGYGQCGTNAEQLGSKLEDPNGNMITRTTDSNGVDTYTDTINRRFVYNPPPTYTTDFSGCLGTLPTSGASLWSIPGPNGSTETYKLCNAQVFQNMPGICGSDPTCQPVNTNGNYIQVIQAIVLPSGKSWVFDYASADPNNPQSVGYGDLLKITFPTGGSISYTWASSSPGCGTTDPGHPFVRVVTSRTVDANDGQGPQTWTYNGTVTDPLGNQTVHTFS